jgi:RimJ/RimL family protein N-acetyltransferase
VAVIRFVSYAALAERHSGGAVPVAADGVVALRRWSADDVAVLVECLNDPEIGRWIDQIPQPYTEHDAQEFLATAGDAFAFVDAVTGEVLGGLGTRWSETGDVAEVGYWIRRDARGRGLTARALVLLARWAVERGAARVQLRADISNTASRRVAEKAGFQFEGVLRSERWSPRQQRRWDWAMYSLLPDELP